MTHRIAAAIVAAASITAGSLAVGRTAHGQGERIQVILVDSMRVRPVLRALWEESVREGKERVACIGGHREGNKFRITKAASMHSLVSRADSIPSDPDFDSDSLSVSRYLSLMSIETCRPPEWVGTIHTHRTEQGVEYPKLSSDDRAVISLWHEQWRRESVFCVLFSFERPPYCEYEPGAR